MISRKHSLLAGSIALLAASSTGFSSTGNFTSPLTNAFLSVDLNGGPVDNTATDPTNGWNENNTTGGFSADPYGVIWSPWGGHTYAGGDGTQLPNSNASPNVNGASISKTFTQSGPPTTDNVYFTTPFVSPPITPTGVTISIDTTDNASKYSQVNSTASMNSRDRGSPSGANGAGDNDMFRDLLFAGANGNVQGTNFLKVQFSLLVPGVSYQVAMYSYDPSGNHTTNWTGTAPTLSGVGTGTAGYWDSTAGTPSFDGTFTAPLDEQSISWTAGTTPAPAVFTEVADGTGTITLYGYGGNGVTGTESADTTYLNGFQVALVPEPASLGLFALASFGLLGRRRRHQAM